LQGDLVEKQDQLAASQGEIATSLISVYKALGGGWQIRCPNFQSRGIPDFESDVVPEELVTPPVPTEETFSN
jgi:hypothetical protein